MRAGLAFDAGHAALQLGARHDQLQCNQQRLREGPVVRAGRDLDAGDVLPTPGSRRDQLQRGDECVRERPMLLAGLELDERDAVLSFRARLDQLQRGHSRVREVPAVRRGFELDVAVLLGSARTKNRLVLLGSPLVLPRSTHGHRTTLAQRAMKAGDAEVSAGEVSSLLSEAWGRV